MRTQEKLALAQDFERSILAIVSHDIRNPLHAIALAAHGIKRSTDTVDVLLKQADVTRAA
jgi:signal transduction histidine kinase